MAQSVHASNYRTRAENNSGYAHRVAEAQGEEELMCVTALVQPFHAFKTVTSLYLRVETYDLMASLLLMVFTHETLDDADDVTPSSAANTRSASECVLIICALPLLAKKNDE